MSAPSAAPGRGSGGARSGPPAASHARRAWGVSPQLPCLRWWGRSSALAMRSGAGSVPYRPARADTPIPSPPKGVKVREAWALVQMPARLTPGPGGVLHG
jgi:hypothetical protein